MGVVNLPDEYYAQGHGVGYEGYTQKHNFVRLLAYTYEDGLHIDSFKMPVACSCHIHGPPKHYGHGYGHGVTPVYHGTPTPVPFHRDSPPLPPLLGEPPLLARDGPFFG